jgi:hypothetical protein
MDEAEDVEADTNATKVEVEVEVEVKLTLPDGRACAIPKLKFWTLQP